MHEYIHFLEEVLNMHEEKHRDSKKGRYWGKVSFDSIVLDHQDTAGYAGYSVPRYKAKSSTDKPEKQTNFADLGNCIVLIVPPCAIERDAVLALKNDYGDDFLETDHLKSSKLTHSSTLKVILVTSLSGLAENLRTHTDKLYYFLFNYT